MNSAETIDKITILELKIKNIKDQAKVESARRELALLSPNAPNVGPFKTLLCHINSVLWDVEDRLRVMEKESTFDEEFILLARSVYFVNDLRCMVKNHISKITGDELKEVKSYINQ
jgi:hypothetical protein